MGKWRNAAVAVAAVVAGGAIAQTSGVAEAPKMAVGDKWEYTMVHADGSKSTWTREIVEIPAADRLRVRQESGNVVDYDAALNFMPEGRREYARELVRYPLKVGDEWPITRKFANPGVAENGKARVVALETVTVPAGSFQCYRIEAEASLNNRSYVEQRKWVRWYCPDVKWIAKEMLDTSISYPARKATESSELVRFTPGK